MNTSPSLRQGIYYDHDLNKYWIEVPPDHWVKVDKLSLEGHLLLGQPWTNANVRAANDAILIVQRDHYVDFAGNLAGYPPGLLVQGDTRILVRSGPTLIEPVAGDWVMLRSILENMFGPEQLPYLLCWIKVSLRMFRSRKWMAGQVLVLCGEPGAGKNLVAWILQKLFGGRMPGKPFPYMSGRTDFNGGFMGCEFLTIEDESSQVGIQARRAFGDNIKDLAVNENRRLHKKHAEAITVTALQRLLISMNNEPERLLVLPPIEKDIEDKMMLFKVYKHDMPMPTNTPAAREGFSQAIIAELPAFVDFLERMDIPEELQEPRFGVRYYHHPEILEALHEQSPEERLLQLIDEVVFAAGLLTKQWYGKSSELDRLLKSADSLHVRREAGDLLPAGNSCGKYLGRLASRCPDRVVKHPGSAGTHRWTIHAPERTADVAVDGNTSTPEHSSAEKSRALIERVRAIVGARPAPEPRQANAGPNSMEMLRGEIQAAMLHRGLH